MLPQLNSSNKIKRYNEGKPVLSKEDIPYPADCIFNAGVTKFKGRYVMVFRDDYGYNGRHFDGCIIGIAFSNSGTDWEVSNRPFLTKEAIDDPDVTRVYDPRLTVIDNRCYICFAVDTHHGVRGGIAVTDDFETVEILSLTVPDNRNMVLFPEKINGYYARLERPFPVYSRGGIDRFDTWISFSRDMKFWGESSLLLPVESVPWSNDKTGPGAPPIRTDEGWLVIFHAVDIDQSRGKNGWEDTWKKRYCAGIMLLDLNDPTKIIGICLTPLIAPETKYETSTGYRTNVVFPGGLIAEPNGTVKIYYGASDTVECLATANIDDLISLCKPL
jgi:beta-1,4-mannooligosaccharide/beta-1,4-mannosyl-N-acetylglucosamine phosphorylase